MRILAITLAALFGVCGIVAATIGNWAEGPAPELGGVGVLFLIQRASHGRRTAFDTSPRRGGWRSAFG